MWLMESAADARIKDFALYKRMTMVYNLAFQTC